MSHTNPDHEDLPGSIPSTVWTRAKDLLVGDYVYVRDQDEDGPGEIIDSQFDAERVLLLIIIDHDGTRVEREYTLGRNRYCMRYLRQDTEPIPVPAAAGLAHAQKHYQGNWDAQGTVSVDLPTAVAVQLLEIRGWNHDLLPDGSHRSWWAPSGDRYWHTSEALGHALSAEVL